MKRNKKVNQNKYEEIIQPNRKFKNSYVHVYTAWENCIIKDQTNDNNIEKRQIHFDIACKQNKLVIQKLNDIGKFPIRYHKFCKFINLKKFNIILNEFHDLALKFVYKISDSDVNSKELGMYIIHGSKFTKISSLQPNSNNITCKIKYDINGSEDLRNSELSAFDEINKSTVNIIGQDLLNCKWILDKFKKMNCDQKLFEQYIFEEVSKKQTESDSDSISNTNDSVKKLVKWIKNIQHNNTIKNTE